MRADRATRARQLRLWAPVVAYAAVIFALSSWSRPPRLGDNDTYAHVLEYGLLGALVHRAMAGGVRAAGGAFLLATAYGASDEWHQSFVPGRESSLADLGADAIGAGLGSLAVLAGGRWRRSARGGLA